MNTSDKAIVIYSVDRKEEVVLDFVNMSRQKVQETKRIAIFKELAGKENK